MRLKRKRILGRTALVAGLLGALGWTASASAAEPAGKAVAPAQAGTASYFGGEMAGRTTASGEPARPESTLTAASRTLPLGTTAKVVNKETGKSVNVKVVDRGPYARRRVIDVSHKAARQLGMQKHGVARVQVQPVHVPKAGE